MKKFIKYLKDCALEMKKVAWPGKTAILSYTKLVIIVSVVFAVLLGLVDFLLLKGMYLIF